MIGICETTLANIMASRNSEYKGSLFKDNNELPKTKIIVKAESVGDSNNEVDFTMAVTIPTQKKCCGLITD